MSNTPKTRSLRPHSTAFSVGCRRAFLAPAVKSRGKRGERGASIVLILAVFIWPHTSASLIKCDKVISFSNKTVRYVTNGCVYWRALLIQPTVFCRTSQDSVLNENLIDFYITAGLKKKKKSSVLKSKLTGWYIISNGIVFPLFFLSFSKA